MSTPSPVTAAPVAGPPSDTNGNPPMRGRRAGRRHLGVLAATLACGGLLACGGDDDRLSASAFRSQGNAICEQGAGELEQLFASAPMGSDATTEDKTAFVHEVAENLYGQADALDAPEAPEELAADVDALLVSLRATIAEVEALGPAFFEEDAQLRFGPTNELAADLGLTTCAEE